MFGKAFYLLGVLVKLEDKKIFGYECLTNVLTGHMCTHHIRVDENDVTKELDLWSKQACCVACAINQGNLSRQNGATFRIPQSPPAYLYKHQKSGHVLFPLIKSILEIMKFIESFTIYINSLDMNTSDPLALKEIKRFKKLSKTKKFVKQQKKQQQILYNDTQTSHPQQTLYNNTQYNEVQQQNQFLESFAYQANDNTNFDNNIDYNEFDDQQNYENYQYGYGGGTDYYAQSATGYLDANITQQQQMKIKNEKQQTTTKPTKPINPTQPMQLHKGIGIFYVIFFNNNYSYEM